MTSTKTCDRISDRLVNYVEGSLDGDEARRIEEHLAECDSCRDAAVQYGAVKNLFEYTRLAKAERPEPVEEEKAAGTGVFSTLSVAPWWFVSVALHVLVIALASLVTMAYEVAKTDDSVIMLTELKPPPPNIEPEKPKNAESALDPKNETAATDLNSKEASDVVVPPDILAKAELGDHFETINPDMPDTHSAFGNPDAKMFHSVEGNAEPAGGGGMGGLGMDDMIGVGGAGSAGSGGGFGGGNGTGTGTGSGAGHGSFGQRSGGGRKLMVKRHGGSPASENAVNKALEWLAYHQEADGHWDANKYGGKDTDVCCTGWALLAFLGAGHTEKVGQYRDNVTRAVGWLIGQQQPNGCLMNRTAGSGMYQGYSHAVAGMALAEAAGMARVKSTKEAAQKAVDYSVNIHQAGEGSEKRTYRYVAGDPVGDISNHGWFVMHLKSAKVAGLSIPHGGIEGAIWCLDNIYEAAAGAGDKNKNDSGYDNGRHRYSYHKGDDITHRRTRSWAPPKMKRRAAWNGR